jgi:hypothetical protein
MPYYLLGSYGVRCLSEKFSRAPSNSVILNGVLYLSILPRHIQANGLEDSSACSGRINQEFPAPGFKLLTCLVI